MGSALRVLALGQHAGGSRLWASNWGHSAMGIQLQASHGGLHAMGCTLWAAHYGHHTAGIALPKGTAHPRGRGRPLHTSCRSPAHHPDVRGALLPSRPGAVPRTAALTEHGVLWVQVFPCCPILPWAAVGSPPSALRFASCPFLLALSTYNFSFFFFSKGSKRNHFFIKKKLMYT